MNTVAINRKAIRTKSITTILAVVISVVLPQLFHAAGAVSGQGAVLGTTFLPMQLPVLIAGFVAGPAVGVIAGMASPVISFAIFGMPEAAMLPFLMIELAGYGLAAGLLAKVKMSAFFKVVIAQFLGRILRVTAVLFAIYVLGNMSLTLAGTWNIIRSGLPGILLQWAIVPLFLYRMEDLKKYYE